MKPRDKNKGAEKNDDNRLLDKEERQNQIYHYAIQ